MLKNCLRFLGELVPALVLYFFVLTKGNATPGKTLPLCGNILQGLCVSLAKRGCTARLNAPFSERASLKVSRAAFILPSEHSATPGAYQLRSLTAQSISSRGAGRG